MNDCVWEKEEVVWSSLKVLLLVLYFYVVSFII